MLDSRKASVRFQAIALLGISHVPKPIAAELIRKALRDKAHKVRAEAAAVAERLGLAELLPELLQALRVEGHALAKKLLEFHIALLRDGYVLECEHDQPILTVKLAPGIGWWRSFPVTRKDITDGKLKAIVADAKLKL
jgi:hypothetical protein